MLNRTHFPSLNKSLHLLTVAALVIGLTVGFEPVPVALAATPDISVTKTDTPDPVLLGSQLTYTLRVANSNASRAAGVVLTDMLPVSVTVSSVTTTRGSCTRLGNLVTCSLGNLPKNKSATVTISVIPTTTGTITNTATATTTNGDSNPDNNTGITLTTVVIPAANLSVTKTDTPDPVLVGAPLTYIVSVSNFGPLNATNTVLTDTLPPVESR